MGAIEAMISDMVHEGDEIDIRTISLRMEINQTECKRIVREMASKGKVLISGARSPASDSRIRVSGCWTVEWRRV